jgi:hypothetical protein
MYVLVVQMGEPGSCRGRHFGGMNRSAGLSRWYAKGKQGCRRDEPKGHPESTVHELCDEANSNQGEKLKGHGGSL